jgi:hypothetical protein
MRRPVRRSTLLAPVASLLASALLPVPAHAAGPTYSLATSPTRTVLRWNPCAPIHYRVNVAHAPRGSLADTRAAIAKVQRATGLRFVYDGQTSAVPQKGYGESSPSGHAPPLTIAWARPGTGKGASSLLQPSMVGVGGMVWGQWLDAGHRLHPWQAISGYVVLNDLDNAVYHRGFGSGLSRGEVLLHELGHAMGLQHVTDRRELMYPVALSRRAAAYAAGDLAGLRRLGRSAGCISTTPFAG